MSAIPTGLDLDAAIALLRTLPQPRHACRTVPLEHAAGHVLAADVRAHWSLPRFSNAAVDGWAVRLADCRSAEPTPLRVHGRIAAGALPPSVLLPGCAVRIFTGAPLPPGADVVVMQEHARVADATVLVPAGLRRGQNVRVEGEQAGRGDVLLHAGVRLGAAGLALAASSGTTTVQVVPPLRVGLLSTGNEIWPVGTMPSPGGIPDANGVMLAALLRAAGAEVVPSGVVRDDAEALTHRLLAMATCCDLLVTTGGVSVGEEDHLRGVLSSAGRLLFWRLAIKPGRPTALGSVGGVPVLALPGNPAAAFTVFHVLGLPLLRHLGYEGRAGTSGAPSFLARSVFARQASPGMHDLVPIIVTPEGEARAAMPDHGVKGSLSELVAADGLALLGPACTSVTPGDLVRVLLFRTPPRFSAPEGAGQAQVPCL